MQPSVRLLSRKALSSRSFFVCSNCRHQVTAHSLSPLTHQIWRYASNDSKDFLDSTRRRLWGTDKPPGPDDPYYAEEQWQRDIEQKGLSEEEMKREFDPEAEDDLSPQDEYLPAQNWTNLPQVGYLPEVLETEESNEADKLTPFTTHPIKNFERIKELALQATKEICLMHMLGKPLAKVCDVETHEKLVLESLESCKLETCEPGDWSTAIHFPDEETKNLLVYVFEQIGGNKKKKITKAPESEKRQEPLDHLHLSLAHPTTKFAFIKRFSQLTGHRFPDPIINSATTVEDCVKYLVTPKKPTRVHQKLKRKRRIGELHNFKFSGGRVPASFKDEEVGRQKAILTAFYERDVLFKPGPGIPRRQAADQTEQ